MHYWTSYCARQALGVPQPQAKGPPDPQTLGIYFNCQFILKYFDPYHHYAVCCVPLKLKPWICPCIWDFFSYSWTINLILGGPPKE